ncbi:18645_t:CDS:1, partial [Gigaspora margarita]
LEVVEDLTKNLLVVSQQHNNLLIKDISLEKITNTINVFSNCKAP